MNFSGVSDRTSIGKALRFPLQLIPKHLQVPILQGPLRGKQWIAGSSNHGCWLGSYEHDKQIAFIRQVNSGDIVYDLGANVGYYSLLASVLVGNSGHVYSFEPLPDNLEYLRKHLQLNRVTNCTVYDCAVSTSSGVVKFELGKDRSMGHIGTSGIEVVTVALDELIRESKLQAPDLINVTLKAVNTTHS